MDAVDLAEALMRDAAFRPHRPHWAAPMPTDAGSRPGHARPASSSISIGVVGFLGYGISLVLFVAALRHLGAARTSAYFSFAPFIGAVLGIAFLGEPVTWTLAAAGGLMAVGLYLHLAERHSHEHVHEPIEHEHGHVHDENHQHQHAVGEAVDGRHAHSHRHVSLAHRHPHYPDLHHRHLHR